MMKSKYSLGLNLFCILLFVVNNNFIFAQEAQEEEGQAVQATTAEGLANETTTEAVTSILEIKRLDSEEPLYSFELRDADIGDLFRVLAHDYKLNLMVDKDVQGKVTASLSNLTLEEALETIAESQNLALKKKGKIIKISPNLVTKTFTLKYVEAKKILESSAAGTQTGTSATTTTTSEATTETSATTAATQTNTIYDLLSNMGKVLLGKQPNSIIVIDYPPNIEKVEDYLKVVDQRMSTRIFKLKYLKATDVVGETETNTTITETNTTGGS